MSKDQAHGFAVGLVFFRLILSRMLYNMKPAAPAPAMTQMGFTFQRRRIRMAAVKMPTEIQLTALRSAGSSRAP